jgi:hypothetical protein
MLEHEAHVAALGRGPGGVLARDRDGAAVGRLEPGDHAQQRGLAAATRAEQRGERAVAHLERDAVERHEVTEALGNRVHDDAHP